MLCHFVVNVCMYIYACREKFIYYKTLLKRNNCTSRRPLTDILSCLSRTCFGALGIGSGQVVLSVCIKIVHFVGMYSTCVHDMYVYIM